MTEHPGHGPYETEGSAYLDAAHVYDAARERRETSLMARINEGLLLGTCRTLGIETGQYDRRIIGWIAGWEPDLVQVITALIERAHAAGRDQLDQEMADLRKRVTSLETAARRAAPINIDLDELLENLEERLGQ